MLPGCTVQSSDILTFLCWRNNNFENLLPKSQVSQLLKGQIDGDINLIIKRNEGACTNTHTHKHVSNNNYKVFTLLFDHIFVVFFLNE